MDRVNRVYWKWSMYLGVGVETYYGGSWGGLIGVVRKLVVRYAR